MKKLLVLFCALVFLCMYGVAFADRILITQYDNGETGHTGLLPQADSQTTPARPSDLPPPLPRPPD